MRTRYSDQRTSHSPWVTSATLSHRAGSLAGWLVLVGGIATIPALLTNDETLRTAFIAFACLAGSAACTAGCIRVCPQRLTPPAVAAACSLQFFWLLFLTILGAPLGPVFHSFQFDLSQDPLRGLLPSMAMPTACFLTAVACASRRAAPHSAYHNLFLAGSRTVFYLKAAAVLQLLYWLAVSEDSGILGYVTRVLASSLFLAPCAAGALSRDDRGLARVWVISLVLNAVVGLLVGGRYIALAPVALFMIGRAIAARPSERVTVLWKTAAVGVVAVLISAAVGSVRSELGRGGIELVNLDRAAEMVSAIRTQVTSNSGRENWVATEGISRMIVWSNVIVPSLSPDTVPYRGFDSFFAELAQSSKIARVAGLTRDDYLSAGLGSAPAVAYGFAVDQATSVEFGVVADAWSRAGLAALPIFCLCTVLVLVIVETAAWRMTSSRPAASFILLLLCAQTAFLEVTTAPLLAILRALILRSVTIGCVIFLVDPVLRLQQAKSGPPLQRGPSSDAR